VMDVGGGGGGTEEPLPLDDVEIQIRNTVKVK